MRRRVSDSPRYGRPGSVSPVAAARRMVSFSCCYPWPRDLRRLRSLATGSDAAPPRTARRIAKVTGGQILLSLAGMDGEELFDPTLLGTADKVRPAAAAAAAAAVGACWADLVVQRRGWALDRQACDVPCSVLFLSLFLLYIYLLINPSISHIMYTGV